MSTRANYFKIGVFVLAGFFLLAGALIYLGAGNMFRPRIYLETYVDGTVQGIDLGSPVKFRGVQIGRISKVDFCFNIYGPQPDNERLDYVYLEMEVDVQVFRGMFTEDISPVVAQAVEQGLRVKLQPQGVTGLNFAELNYVADPAQFPPLRIWWTPRHHYIPSAPGTLTSLVDSLNRIMDTVGALDVGRTLRDAEQAMEAFTSMSRKLEGEVGGLQLAQTSAELRALLADIKAKLDDFPAERLGADAGEVLKSLIEMSAQMRDAAAKIESNPLLSKKAAQGIINDAQATAANLRELSESLRENPGQLIFGRPKKASQQPRR